MPASRSTLPATAALLIAVGALWPVSVARADDDPLARTQRELEAERARAAAEGADRVSVGVGGELALGYLQSGLAGDRDFAAWRADLRLYASADLGAGQKAFVRLRALYDNGLGKEVFVHGDGTLDEDRADAYLDRWWYRLDVAEAAGQSGSPWDFSVQAGRQHVAWGAGLVLDGDLYALRTTLSHASAGCGRVSLDLIGGYTPDEDFYDFDHSRRWYNSEHDRLFYGLMLSWQSNAPWRTRVYGYALAQQDYGSGMPKPFLDVPFISGVHTYDSEYFGVGASGRVLSPRLGYAAEVVAETGKSMTSPFYGPQQEESIRAFAGTAMLTWDFMDTARTRVEAEAIFASGDSDRLGSSTDTSGGNRPGTRDESFNAFGYLRTGFAFNAPVSNLQCYRLGVSTDLCPAARLRGGVDGYLFRKLDGAGASQESFGGEGSDLGSEVDLHLDWQALSDLTLQLRYGAFFPGAASSDERDARHFLFAGVRYGF